MNPRNREIEPTNFMVPEQTTTDRLSYKQRALQVLEAALLILAGNGSISAPTISAQTNPSLRPVAFLPLVEKNISPPTIPELTSTPTPILIYSPWLPDIADMLKRLPIVEGLRLVEINNSNRDLVPCGQGGACYHSPSRTAYIEVGSPFGGIRHAQAHEACHAHQHWSILQAGLGEPNPNLQSWLNTSEGRAYRAASDQVLRDHITLGRPLPWGDFGSNLIEDFANICPPWYIDFGGEGITEFPSLVSFAQQWLPLDNLTPTPTPIIYYSQTIP